VLGTVAGDDTVLVLADQLMGGDELTKLMREVAGLPG